MSEKIKEYSYCTLFDSNFSSVGTVMINSLLRYSQNARLYVLCMDERIEDILKERYFKKESERLVLVNLKEFMTEELLLIRTERSWREFCWTCSAMIIKYVFNKYNESICTYIDADLKFYANPDELVDEMIKAEKSVQIVEHRFKNNRAGRRQIKESGRFCVQFNSFKNNKDGNKVLDDWINGVKTQCSEDVTQGLGDQFYLDEWPLKYDCINILKNLGAGIAPWNIDRYKVVKYSNEGDNESIVVKFDNDKVWKAYFFHFTHISLYDGETVNINVFHRYYPLDKKTVYAFYIPYLQEVVNYSYNTSLANVNKVSENNKTIRKCDFLNRALCKTKELLNGNADFIKLKELNALLENVLE